MSAWLSEMLLATALLMALVLAERPLVRRSFGAGAAYALWLVPALRVVLPPIDLPRSELTGMTQPIDIVLASATAVPDPGAWMLAVWAAGAAVFIGWQLIAYHRFVSRALGGSDDPIIATGAVEGPAAVGLFSPRILVPRDFATRFDAAERDLALRHERAHIERGDLWANAAALGVLALHWFNPLAHFAYRAFREDQELACDAAVIANAGPGARAAYGTAMIKAAWPGAPKTTCPMTRTTNLKRRLHMIRMHRTSKLASAGGALSVGLIALAGLTLTATSGIAAEPAVKKVTVKRLTGADATKVMSEAEIDSRCGGNAAKFEVGPMADPAGKTRPARLVLCRKDGKGASSEGQLSALRAARAEMLTSTELDARQRAQSVAAIDSAIATLEAAN